MNIDCPAYQQLLLASAAVHAADPSNGLHGNQAHSWFIGTRIFTLDLFETLKGDLEHRPLSTRSPVGGS